MPTPEAGQEDAPAHVEIDAESDGASPRPSARPDGSTMRDSKGWDGKLRAPKATLIQNPDAISDPEYSDEDNVLPGEEIKADEGEKPMACPVLPSLLLTNTLPRLVG